MMFPTRLISILAGLTLLMAFALGVIHWNNQPYKCFSGKHFYGDWTTVYAIGRLEWRVKQYGCPASDRYDPNQFRSLYDPSATKSESQ